MPGYHTDYLNNKLLDLVWGAVAFTSPVTLYFGLSKVAANKAGTISEVSGGSYVRKSMTNNLTNFPGASAGTKANATVITFVAPTADWSTIVAPVVCIFVADDVSAGNVLAMCDIPPAAILSGGTAPSFAVGALFLGHT